MAAADYRLMTEATGVRIAEALEDVTAMVGPKGDTGEVSEAELTAKLADKADVIVDTASGAIASFPDGMAAPAKDVTIGIEPVQSGSGAPSPTNVRPISGWTGANVVVSPTTDAQDGTTYPISWETEAGTVYGGTLDVTTGLLKVDRICYSFTGDEQISLSDSDPVRRRFDTKLEYLGLPPERISNEEISSHFCQQQANIAPFGNFYIENPYLVFTDKNAMFPTANAFKSWLAGQKNNGTPVQICYPLATPQTYQLTPTEVVLLLGDNNVWADTGDSTVTYRADTKLYIQKINTPSDDDMIADAQIASGKYFIVGGNLYRSTTTIPAWDTITPGTNCILTNLSDALNALNT